MKRKQLVLSPEKKAQGREREREGEMATTYRLSQFQ